MDESLSDFEEPVKRPKGPKKTNDAKQTKLKTTRNKIRVQKDIRTALKGKQELEKYAKDFDKVCKKAGIDVDTEELQLAIAVSKSLQNCPSTSCNNSQRIGAESSQKRFGKIRTTLLEYGFKVPEIKITTATRKQRRLRNNYKLISTTDEQKNECISKRYTEVLLRNLNYLKSQTQNPNNVTPYHCRIYYLATNAHYGILRYQDTFYVDNLIERSMSSGNLLRDWSDIPGRAASPKMFEPSNMNFSEISCSQKEIDVILSGPLNNCKDIMSRKCTELDNCDLVETVIDNNVNNDLHNTNNDQISSKSLEVPANNKEVFEALTIETKQNRSVSPDIFDDDDDCINIDNDSLIKENIPDKNKPPCDNHSSNFKMIHDHPTFFVTNSNTTKRKSNDDMEMTECIDKDSTAIIYPITQKSDITKRFSKDFMEITECASTSSQRFSVGDKIDLTQMKPITEKETYVKTKNTTTDNNVHIEKAINNISIDLTDIPDSFNIIHPSKKDHREHINVRDDDNIDLTQTSDDSDELPFVSFKRKDNPADVLIALNDKDGNIIDGNTNLQNEEIHIDLTQNDENAHEINKPNQSFFEDYVHNHSQNSEDRTRISGHAQITRPITPTNKESKKSKINSTLSPILKPSNEDNVDLTQKSDSSENLSPCSSQIESILQTSSKDFDNDLNVSSLEYNRSLVKSQTCSSLGKRGDVSIDYDDLTNTLSEIKQNLGNQSLPTYEINEEDHEPSQSNLPSNCSQNSEVFHISDKELDYSINRSKLERPLSNFALGGLSILDDVSSLKSFKKSTDPICTPDDNIQDMKENVEKNQQTELSPIKHKRIHEIANKEEACGSNLVHTVSTPKNSKLIIKTNNVTPMIDYESMSTPEIHNELDKYGIKPFKRKRAIQLLTHIYNQTHPVIETCDETASPPKRRRPNEHISPRKTIPQRRLLKSPQKLAESKNAKKDIQTLRLNDANQWNFNSKDAMITGNEKMPISIYIECQPEDWVFQKKEKAKVHSCRVPLHIAFYNFVRSNSELRQAILCYEPINIDDVHTELAGHGHKYDPKNLLKFMDKKCITVKTTDNDARNHKR